jgi:hypothetical protein
MGYEDIREWILVMFGGNDCDSVNTGTGNDNSAAHTSRYNDDDDENDQPDDYAHAHLHVFPPHLLPDSVCASSEALSRDCKVIGLVLERV